MILCWDCFSLKATQQFKGLSSCEALWVSMHQQQLCHLRFLLTLLRQDGRKPTKPQILFIPLHKIKFGGDAWLAWLYHQIPEWASIILYVIYLLPVMNLFVYLTSMFSKSWSTTVKGKKSSKCKLLYSGVKTRPPTSGGPSATRLSSSDPDSNAQPGLVDW